MNRLYGRGWLLGATLLIGFLPVVGCTTTPQADSQSFKNARTQNNAALNHTGVVSTSFIPREDVSQTIVRDVPEVETADVLEREGRVFVGVTLQTADNYHTAGTAQKAHIDNTNHSLSPRRTHTVAVVPKNVSAQVIQAVRKIVPNAKAIYVTNDETLTYHFHMFAGDHATGRKTGSDMILDDVSRVFPNYV